MSSIIFLHAKIKEIIKDNQNLGEVGDGTWSQQLMDDQLNQLVFDLERAFKMNGWTPPNVYNVEKPNYE